MEDGNLKKRKVGKGKEGVSWASWAPATALHLYMTYLVLETAGPGSGLVEFSLYLTLSWTLGFAILIIALVRNTLSSNAVLCIAILAAGPVLTGQYAAVRNTYYKIQFAASSSSVETLCREQGKEVIYRTVDDVDGVLQMVAMPSYHKQLKSKLGRRYPWNRMMGDSDSLETLLGTSGKGYLFIERPAKTYESGPPYKRTLLVESKRNANGTSGQGDKNGPRKLSIETIEVLNHKSRYGWQATDITTHKMRKRWIGAGKVAVIDLITGEVLAEQVGFFNTKGRQDGSWSYRGSPPKGCPTTIIDAFLPLVLKPAKDFPSRKTLESLKE